MDRLQSGPWKYGQMHNMTLRMTIDSASQEFVTVRRILSDDPASEPRQRFGNFGGVPFLTAGITVPHWQTYSCKPRLYRFIS